MRIANQILGIFDRPGYSDDNAEAQAEVFKLMNEVSKRYLSCRGYAKNSQMQTHGSPPAEVMGELPDGITSEGLASGDGCVIS
jgi:peroxin-19